MAPPLQYPLDRMHHRVYLISDAAMGLRRDCERDTAMELHEKATAALSWFTAGERVSEDTGRAITKTHDDAPDWITGLCREAHGDMFPDDWRYEFIYDALSYLSEENDPDDYNPEPSVYNAELLRWLAPHLERAGYCDEAAKEFGSDAEGGILGNIGRGQWQEMSEVFGLVRSHLEGLDDDEVTTRKTDTERAS